jgi:hypothetical protein
LIQRVFTDELMHTILSYLGPYTLGRIACVCQQWRQFAEVSMDACLSSSYAAESKGDPSTSVLAFPCPAVTSLRFWAHQQLYGSWFAVAAAAWAQAEIGLQLPKQCTGCPHGLAASPSLAKLPRGLCSGSRL